MPAPQGKAWIDVWPSTRKNKVKGKSRANSVWNIVRQLALGELTPDIKTLGIACHSSNGL